VIHHEKKEKGAQLSFLIMYWSIGGRDKAHISTQ